LYDGIVDRLGTAPDCAARARRGASMTTSKGTICGPANRVEAIAVLD
jgi:hypothetical protein